MNKNILFSIFLAAFAQSLSYLQLQGQFINPWMKKNIGVMVLLGLPISYILIKFTKICADGFGGEVWPGRLIGFAVGAIVFAILSYFIMKEPLNLKTILCLFLSAIILVIQIFWKN
jgi:hypothetical protein